MCDPVKNALHLNSPSTKSRSFLIFLPSHPNRCLANSSSDVSWWSLTFHLFHLRWEGGKEGAYLYRKWALAPGFQTAKELDWEPGRRGRGRSVFMGWAGKWTVTAYSSREAQIQQGRAPIRSAACLLVSADADVLTRTDKNAARVSLWIPGRAVFSETLAQQETEKRKSAPFHSLKQILKFWNIPGIGCYNVKQCTSSALKLWKFSSIMIFFGTKSTKSTKLQELLNWTSEPDTPKDFSNNCVPPLGTSKKDVSHTEKCYVCSFSLLTCKKS